MLWIRVTGLETLSLIDLFLQNSVQNFPVIDRFFTELGSKLTSHWPIFFKIKFKAVCADPWHFGVDPDPDPRIHASD